MYIFVDESGGFIKPRDPHKISAIGALVVPESQRRPLLRAFDRLVKRWQLGQGEVKGSQLSEEHVAQVIALAKQYDLMLQVCAIDMGLQDTTKVADLQAAQAENITAGLTSEHSINWWNWARDLRAELILLPPQLFVQCMVVVSLLAHVLQNATLFYVLRRPRELGSFRWRIDAKDILVTPFEKLWTELLLPMIQSHSMNEPLITIQDANYKHFSRFDIPRNSAPSPMREHMEMTGRPGGVDLRKFFREDFKFVNSRDDSGVQLTDILVTATTRALNGNLREEGWGDLGSLLVRGVHDGLVVVRLERGANSSKMIVTPWGEVAQKLMQRAQDIFPV